VDLSAEGIIFLCFSSLIITPEAKFDYEHHRPAMQSGGEDRHILVAGGALDSQMAPKYPSKWQAGCHYQLIGKFLEIR
jgi:hypothetical protein